MKGTQRARQREEQTRMLLACRRLAFSSRRLSTASSDHFSLLSLQRRFDLDEAELQRTYKRLMAECHPDRFGQSSEAERAAAADRAAAITDAYSVLCRPYQRATHLLELLGAPLTEEDGTSGGAALLGPEFLMEVMELREELEARPAAPRLLELRDQNRGEAERLGADLAAAFAAAELDEARQLAAQLQYVQRVADEISEQLPHE